MKIIGISSSGRKNSYSKQVVKDIVEASKIDYEMIDISKLKIKGCMGCLQCAKDNACVQEDDFNDVINKINKADALVFGGGNYYGMLNAIGHSFWERTFALRHREAFLLAGKPGVAVGMDRSAEQKPATNFIKKMMLSNKMEVIAEYTASGNHQCYDCGYGHECVVGNVYADMGLVTKEEAARNRPEEYIPSEKQRAVDIGNMLGSILRSR